VTSRGQPRESAARRNGDIEIRGIGDDVLHRAPDAVHLAADDLDLVPPCVGHLGNLRSRDALVARVHHLVRGRQVGPELKAVHAALGIARGHLLVHDAASRGHPLHVARGDHARVSRAVAVLDLSGQHIGDRLDAAVGVPGEALAIMLRRVGPKVIQQQERIRQLRIAKADHAVQVDAGPFGRGPGRDDLTDAPVFAHAKCLLLAPLPSCAATPRPPMLPRANAEPHRRPPRPTAAPGDA